MTVTELRRMCERAERKGLGGLPVRVEVWRDQPQVLRFVYPEIMTTVQSRQFRNVSARARAGASTVNQHATLSRR